MMRLVRATVVVAAVAVGAGCLDDSITGTRPLTLDLSVQPSTAAVADTVTATWTATGTGLQGVIVDWGDGRLDSLSLGGLAVEAGQDVDHVYTIGGTYTVTARAEDQTGARTASATVEIN